MTQQVLETEERMYAAIHEAKRAEYETVNKLRVEVRDSYYKIMTKLSMSEREVWRSKLNTLTLRVNTLRNEEDASYWDWSRAGKRVQELLNRQVPQES